jgi:hypothetical protein
MSAENFKSIYNIPFYLEQKQLITVCGHPSKEIFVPLPILVAVDSFIIDGNLYPAIFDKPNVILNTSL